jgi:hypothetical protein
MREQGCNAVILPGPVVSRLANAGFFTGAEELATVTALWRSPEQMSASAAWRERNSGFMDVLAFGEAGLIAARRGISGRPAPIPFGPITAPRGAPGAVLVAELTRTEAGTIALRGPSVPRHAFPPGVERSGLPYFKAVQGVVDTGYTCRVDPDTRTMAVTGPPAGIVSVGGYRFALRELQNLVAGIAGEGRIAALPDTLTGQRLFGVAADAGAVRAVLTGRGVNPLVVGAFAGPANP